MEGRISFKEFSRIDLRVGRVIYAERIKRSKKLILLKVDLGDEERRLVAGLADYYTPEELVGKLVVVVTNLQPKTMMGVVSDGMLLAAVDEGKPILIVPEKEVRPGAKIT